MSTKNAETPKRRIEGDVARLDIELKTADLVVFDLETTGLDPHRDRIVGAGFYFPHTDRCFYVNLLHSFRDSRYPETTVDQFKRALSPFLRRRGTQVVSHNATFEIRFLWRLGLRPRCRFTDTMPRVHRIDECLRQYAHKKGSSYHPLLEKKVGYGLKQLTASLFHERPPTITDTTGNSSVVYAPVYCISIGTSAPTPNRPHGDMWTSRRNDE
ncbi:MAG: ribonuclease H-like domain-containing protein [Planctomycetota bacterium]